MKTTSPFGLFVLGYPVLVRHDGIRFGDRCYAETLSFTREFVPMSMIVARTREHKTSHGFHARLEDVCAKLALALPDYGIGGWQGFLRTFIILTSPTIRRSLRALLEQAEFIYVEGGTSPVAFLTAQIARQMGRCLILEMRGSVVFNRHYMRQRFGLPGLAYQSLHHVFSAYVRRQSVAGLYISKDLMQRYPVAGSLRCEISDAYLPEDFGSAPRHFTGPARRYLYVGHLETVKRVDLILRALHLAREYLPHGWHFAIVGSGPLEADLRALVDQLELGEHVSFHGRVQWGDPIKKFYHQADILLLASTTESGPRVAVEAMASGLPVISTSVGITPELLDESVLVPVGDINTYAHRLAELINDPIRLTEFSERNWRLAQDFQQPILEAKRREFWKQAIEMSRRTAN